MNFDENNLPGTQGPHPFPSGAKSPVPEDIRVPWGWFDLLTFVLFSILGAVLLLLLFLVFARGSELLGSGSARINIVFQVVLDLLCLGYLAAQMRLRFRAPFWRTVGWRPIETVRIPRGWMCLSLVAAGLVLDVVVTLASSISPPKKALPIDAMFQDRLSALLFMLVAVVAAPLIEETVFRGYIYPVLARSWGMASGVLVTGMLFGGAHAPQLWKAWWQIAALVFVGIVLTLVRATTRTVVASFIVHTSYNSFQVIAILIGTHGLRDLPSLH